MRLRTLTLAALVVAGLGPTTAAAGGPATFNTPGNTLISDQFNHRVFAVGREGVILQQFGNLNVADYGATSTTAGLNAPYDAKVIGDNTGLTWFDVAATPGI